MTRWLLRNTIMDELKYGWMRNEQGRQNPLEKVQQR